MATDFWFVFKLFYMTWLKLLQSFINLVAVHAVLQKNILLHLPHLWPSIFWADNGIGGHLEKL